jgi:hypothetical protein
MSRILFLIGYLALPILLLCCQEAKAKTILSSDSNAFTFLIIGLILFLWLVIYNALYPVTVGLLYRKLRERGFEYGEAKEILNGLTAILCILACMFNLYLLT